MRKECAFRIVRPRQGMTLIDTLLGIFVISMIAFAVYQSYAVLLRILSVSRVKIAATSVANQEMELMRNMPYMQVGVAGGIPAGVIPAVQSRFRDAVLFSLVTTVRNVDDAFDGTATTTPADTSPADYKIVELTLTCTSCVDASSYRFTGRIAPKNLEGSSANGALFIQAIDANGQPVSGAHVEIINNKVMPPIAIMDPGNTTGNDGFLRFVDAPPSAPTYEIKVTKAGYSTDRTYATTTGNPNPIRPHAMVAAQTVTQASFAIDRTSIVNVSSVTGVCASVADVPFSFTGTKLIGTAPNIPKFSANYSTGTGGAAAVSNLEWDTYAVGAASQSHDLAGTIPIVPLELPPNATQALKLVMQPKNPNALLVTVKDDATGLPVAGASTTLVKAGFSQTFTTGRGSLIQSDWSGGGGQANFTDPAMYAEDDGNVAVASPAGEVKLRTENGAYVSAGTLTSSTFDTGSASTFYAFAFEPLDQPPAAGNASVRFQFASATTSVPAVWSFLGPDGTSGSFYTAGNSNIGAAHTGDRYFRYKMLLSTASSTFTPTVADVSATFASECIPPGQVLFSGLQGGTYTLRVAKASPYASFVEEEVTIGLPWQERIMIPPSP